MTDQAPAPPPPWAGPVRRGVRAEAVSEMRGARGATLEIGDLDRSGRISQIGDPQPRPGHPEQPEAGVDGAVDIIEVRRQPRARAPVA